MDNQVRYDSIWRRIKSDDYASKLEGQFREARDRLAELNNWGSLGWLYPHATATKLAHHYGVEHNAQHFLNADPLREKYRPSFRIASHVLHWGHMPLSYAGAEGILRAAHVDEEAKKVIEGVLREVVSFGALQCDSATHKSRCFDRVLAGDQPFELYKWLSAWLVGKRWRKIWSATKGLLPEGADEDRIKEEVVRTLVCHEDFGYELLSLARMADYVPRDLQQAGTAWLTFDIEALWEVSPLRPDRAQEWSLLEASRHYLEERFFVSQEALLVHSLAARVIAQGIISQGLNRDLLATMLTSGLGDDFFFQKLPDYHRRRLKKVRSWAKGETLSRFWSHIGTFDGISAPRSLSLLGVEDIFTKRVGTGKLSYPWAANISVVIEGSARRPADPDLQLVTLQLHHRDEGKEESFARPVLDVAFDAYRRQWSYQDDVGQGLSAWIGKCRTDIRCRLVRVAAGEALGRDETLVRDLLPKLRDHRSFSSSRTPLRWRRQMARLAFMHQFPGFLLGRTMLEMPLSAARSPDGRALLETLRSRAVEEAEGANSQRGFFLEAAIAADQLLAADQCAERYLILGATELSEEGSPIGEWDILRLDLLADGDWRLVAVECGVTPTSQKEDADREKLERLRKALQDRFVDLVEFRTRLATVEDGLVYKDAARGFVRT